MRGMISRILTAIAQVLRGFFKLVMKGGKVTYEWVAGKAAPAIGEVVLDVADTVGRTARAAFHAVPNLMSRFTAAPAVALAPQGNEAAPLDVQRDARQAVLDNAVAADRKRGMAIIAKAAARALLRGQEPVGLTAPVRLWLSSLTEHELGTLAGMSVEDVTRGLDGDDNQPLGKGMRVAAWERTARNNLAASASLASRPARVPSAAARAREQATPIVQMRDHLEARVQERLQRRLRGLGPVRGDEVLHPHVVGR